MVVLTIGKLHCRCFCVAIIGVVTVMFVDVTSDTERPVADET